LPPGADFLTKSPQGSQRTSNPKADGDVLRMQSLHRVRVKADDVAVASDHGRELLDYVLADLERRD
jgi:hypothetical protein